MRQAIYQNRKSYSEQCKDLDIAGCRLLEQAGQESTGIPLRPVVLYPKSNYRVRPACLVAPDATAAERLKENLAEGALHEVGMLVSPGGGAYRA